jgi:large conductance mechanosensitive channel
MFGSAILSELGGPSDVEGVQGVSGARQHRRPLGIGGGQTIDLNVLISAIINFVLIAAVVYFVVVLPYNTYRKRGEVEQAQDTELSILTEIRDLLSANGQAGGRRTTGPGTGPSPDTAETTSADKS